MAPSRLIGTSRGAAAGAVVLRRQQLQGWLPTALVHADVALTGLLADRVAWAGATPPGPGALAAALDALRSPARPSDQAGGAARPSTAIPRGQPAGRDGRAPLPRPDGDISRGRLPRPAPPRDGDGAAPVPPADDAAVMRPHGLGALDHPPGTRPRPAPPGATPGQPSPIPREGASPQHGTPRPGRIPRPRRRLRPGSDPPESRAGHPAPAASPTPHGLLGLPTGSPSWDGAAPQPPAGAPPGATAPGPPAVPPVGSRAPVRSVPGASRRDWHPGARHAARDVVAPVAAVTAAQLRAWSAPAREAGSGANGPAPAPTAPGAAPQAGPAGATPPDRGAPGPARATPPDRGAPGPARAAPAERGAPGPSHPPVRDGGAPARHLTVPPGGTAEPVRGSAAAGADASGRQAPRPMRATGSGLASLLERWNDDGATGRLPAPAHAADPARRPPAPTPSPPDGDAGAPPGVDLHAGDLLVDLVAAALASEARRHGIEVGAGRMR